MDHGEQEAVQDRWQQPGEEGAIRLDEHKDGTLAQMADELKHRYPDYPEEMAVACETGLAGKIRARQQSSAGGGRTVRYRSA
jgi:hypothetical protein